jgi:transposase-like protein
MEFPITNLLSHEESVAWISEHFHPQGLKCASCQAEQGQSHVFRTTAKSQLTTYRCNRCGQTYNLYSGTVFQQRHLRPEQVVLLVRGVVKGEPATTLAAELDLDYKTVLQLRRDLQANAHAMQPSSALMDSETETDEMFQNAGEKRR